LTIWGFGVSDGMFIGLIVFLAATNDLSDEKTNGLSSLGPEPELAGFLGLPKNNNNPMAMPINITKRIDKYTYQIHL